LEWAVRKFKHRLIPAVRWLIRRIPLRLKFRKIKGGYEMRRWYRWAIRI
jgi:hypothetical protein